MKGKNREHCNFQEGLLCMTFRFHFSWISPRQRPDLYLFSLDIEKVV